jgi:4-hydroxythreonine-4-phosphate dehydrogenase
MPRIILTSGEPAGIGPDLCLAMAEREWACDLIVAGDLTLLQARAKQLGSNIALITYVAERDRIHQPGSLRVLHRPTSAPVQPGVLNVANARYVLELLDLACDGCLRDEFDAMVTAPVQKSIISDSGIEFSGHTEYLAQRTGGQRPVMMLLAGTLRVALATTHIPLSSVSRAINQELLEDTLQILERELRERFNIPSARILVLGLNPHAGESGHLGQEEIEIITPVLQRLRSRGMNLTGPAPADTAFTPHMLKQADAVLAMYHDQGLPALKYAGFGNAVNVTLGLPIIRTSVDHGTALSLAGTGQADPGSLIAALQLAIEMAERTRKKGTGAEEGDRGQGTV